ncbi:MAG: T9SS C-terminal target domain-containing protein [Bacteroidetes bacterium]|nr:MAG: T9SS C-terminal target domain-containing protein [Bacteroidota bacterium]
MIERSGGEKRYISLKDICPNKGGFPYLYTYPFPPFSDFEVALNPLIMKKILQFFLLLIFLECPLLLSAQPVIDGDMSDADYTTIGSFTSGRDGFGSLNTLGVMKYYTDNTNLYLGITGELTSNDNLVVFFNFSGYGGRGTNTLAGTSTSNIGVFTTNNGGLDGAKMDMDVDFAFAFNEGNGSTNFYMDAARFGSGAAGYLSTAFIGQTNNQNGTSATLDPTGVTGGTGSMELAYHNGFASDANKGVEFKIPIAAFSGVTNAQDVQIFAIITSSTGYVSNECIPGDPGASNLGNDPDLSAIAGQDFFTAFQSLPIDLVAFRAIRQGSAVRLEWSVESELSNEAFFIERSRDARNWETIGTVPGQGDSFSHTDYAFTDTRPLAAANYYRLKQKDFDGSTTWSPVVLVVMDAGVTFERFPNPVSDILNIRTTVLPEEKLMVELWHSNGTLLKTYEWAPDNFEQYFNVNDLPSGSYLVVIKSEKGRVLSTQLITK